MLEKILELYTEVCSGPYWTLATKKLTYQSCLKKP